MQQNVCLIFNSLEITLSAIYNTSVGAFTFYQFVSNNNLNFLSQMSEILVRT